MKYILCEMKSFCTLNPKNNWGPHSKCVTVAGSLHKIQVEREEGIPLSTQHAASNHELQPNFQLSAADASCTRMLQIRLHFGKYNQHCQVCHLLQTNVASFTTGCRRFHQCLGCLHFRLPAGETAFANFDAWKIIPQGKLRSSLYA